MASPVFDDTEALLGMLKNAARSLRRSGPPADEEEAEGLFSVGLVFLSCLLAFLVNLSTFLVIGRTSPVSYQVTVRMASYPANKNKKCLPGITLSLNIKFVWVVA